jgi:hypothetical protein
MFWWTKHSLPSRGFVWFEGKVGWDRANHVLMDIPSKLLVWPGGCDEAIFCLVGWDPKN